MSRRKRGQREDDNGFSEWGGYMAAKKAKLQEQFVKDAAREPSNDIANIFQGVAIFVNGYSVPSADELKLLMMKHGGIYHHYQTDKTTHIIATNLPDTKVKHLKNLNIVKPDWILDSISARKLLDYRQYLLYSHQSKTQPRLTFKQSANEENTCYESNTTIKTVTESIDAAAINRSNIKELTTDSVVNCNGVEEDNKIYLKQKSLLGAGTVPDDVCRITSVASTSKVSASYTKTAREAGFLSEFYSNSRLHHISTMGAAFKQYINKLREESTGIFPGAVKLKTWKQAETVNRLSDASKVVKYKNVVMHIDMDCFFVSVGLRTRPDLSGFPVAVTHAKARSELGSHRAGVDRKTEFSLYKMRREEKFKLKNHDSSSNKDVKPWSDWVNDIDESDSMSEIASCNYEARKHGLKNGMFLGQALKICPDLKTIPYDFEGYKEVSYCLYNTVASYTLDIEAISCDEMFVDCTSLLSDSEATPLELAAVLRAEIKKQTGCGCSTGFGSNRLQARLATRRAKPDGQFYLQPEDVSEFMSTVSVSDLPGVGSAKSFRLAEMGVSTCLDLQQISLTRLQAEFGAKIGDSLYKHCRGEDTKKLVFGQTRKSVSAEVNYGIRFKTATEVDTFLQELAKEVHTRLQEANMKSKLITLKLMIKAKDAPEESAKFLGHGICDSVSRSSSLPSAVGDLATIIREVLSLSRQVAVEPTELRGVGIQMSRLETQASKSSSVLDRFLCPKNEIAMLNKVTQVGNASKQNPSEGKKETNKSVATAMHDFFSVKKHIAKTNKGKIISNYVKPTEIDKDVLMALPEDIRKEVMVEYGLNTETTSNPANSQENIAYSQQSKTATLGEPDQTDTNWKLNISQIDLNVLEELPSDIKYEIESAVKLKQSNNTNNVPGIKSVESSDVEEKENGGPRLDRSLPPDEVGTLIKAWTSSENCPQCCDVSMLADYLEALVVSRRLDSLDVCISCLHRCIEKKQNNDWEEAYFTIIANVQSVMIRVYGLPLHAPLTFRKII